MSDQRTYSWLKTGVMLTLAFHVFYAAWLLLRPVSRHLTLLGDDLFETVGGVLAALFCFFGGTYKQGKTGRSRRVAVLCGLGMSCYAVQQAYIIYPDFMHRPAPITRLTADMFALATYPLLLLGVGQLPRRPLPLSSHLRITLDGLMIITTAVTFSWYFLLGPVLQGAHQSLERKITSVSYPLFDLLLVAFLLLLGRRARSLRQIITLFAVGMAVVIASDSVFMYWSLHSLQHAGTLLDIGWSLGFMLVGVAASTAQHTPTQSADEEAAPAPALWKSFLPYALLPCVAALALYTQIAQGSAFLRHGVFCCSVVLVGLVLVRQVLAILENRELNQRLEALATTDPLTGLFNHRAFHKQLEEEADRAIREGRTLAVAVLDLDNFKFFNDAYGHPAGDEVLRCVAQALKRCCRSQDTVARFGGDEFALLMPQPALRAEQVGATAEALRAEVLAGLSRLSYTPPGAETAIPLTISIGVALLPGDADLRLEVLEIADARLRGFKAGEGNEHAPELLCRKLSHSVSGFSMLNALVAAVDNKDRYTRRHSEDVLAYSLKIAGQMGLDEATQYTLQVAALLHDVGKIGVPDSILRKPGKLTEEEFQAVQQHPMMGAVIVGAVPGFEDTLDVVRHHHERWDGEGYPFGLRGEETPFLARLVAVADAFSAMTTDRPYRKGMDREKALGILRAGAGTQWDPTCVEALLCEYAPTETMTLARAA